MPQRLIAIGDIHGQGTRLNELLKKIKYKEEDFLIFLGDYVDRGEENIIVSKTIRNLCKNHENTILLMGNHEEMWLEVFDSFKRGYQGFFEDILLCNRNGGDKLLKEFDIDLWATRSNKSVTTSLKELTKELSWFYKTKIYHETNDFIFVHAGTLPNIHPKDLEVYSVDYYGFNPACWVREEFIFHDHNLGKKVVFGHTNQYPSTEPVNFGDKICLDLGAGYDDGLLCAMDMVTNEYWTA